MWRFVNMPWTGPLAMPTAGSPPHQRWWRFHILPQGLVQEYTPKLCHARWEAKHSVDTGKRCLVGAATLSRLQGVLTSDHAALVMQGHDAR